METVSGEREVLRSAHSVLFEIPTDDRSRGISITAGNTAFAGVLYE